MTTTDAYAPANCSPGGWCGSCPTPCALAGSGDDAFDSLLQRDLAEAVAESDSDALGCPRWDDPDAECDECGGNFYCYAESADAD